jgi:hypothetical protein
LILADHVEKIACANCGHHLDVSSLPIFTLFNCPECHIQQMVPGKLGNFLLLEELGRGGMGVVYRGMDQALGRPVAIKIMHKSLGDDPQFLENFLREARAAAAINHRNVVQIFSFGREKGQPYLVMELVDGGRLDAYITSSQPLNELQALDICLEVAEGLKAAHEAGLMHGDIKPANILFDKKGVAKVADFGLASFIRQQKAGDRDIWGTPFYIAPEKARRLKSDQRADIYSLGATMFHAMTIRPPFDGDTPTEVVLARLQLPPPDINTVRTDLHAETVRIINRMLAPDTLMRYPNYASLISDLAAARAKIAAEPTGATGGGHPAEPAAGSKLWLFLVLGGVLLTALAGVTLYYAWNKKKDAEPPPVTVAVPVAPAPSVNPFTPAQEEQLIEAIKPLARGAVLAVNNNLEALGLNVLTGPEQREWIRVFQGITLLADRREPDAEEMLRKLPAPPALSTNIASECARLPLSLAHYLLKRSDARVLAATNALTPAWYPPLANFTVGLREWMSATNRYGAVTRLQAYQPADANGPAWPFAFKGLAEHWIKQSQEFDRSTEEAAALAKARKFGDARKLLDEYKGRCSPALQGALNAHIKKLGEQEGEWRKKEEADKKKKADEEWKRKQAEAKKPQPKPEPKPEPVVPPAEVKAVFAATGTNTVRLAIDGDFQTKWTSLPKDNQWFIADLGSNQKISGAVIYWDPAHPLDYKVQVSTDRFTWTDAAKVRDSKGERAVHTFKPIEGRYLRVYSLIRSSTHLNIAINELQVLVNGHKPPPAPPPP